MTESEKKSRLYLRVAVVILLAILLSLKACQKEKIVTKTKTVIKVVEKRDTLTIEKPKLVYKWKDRVIHVTDIDTVFKQFNPKDYAYVFDTITSKTDVKIIGWGDISKVSIISKCKDSVIETKTTVTKTIIKNESAIFLGASYATIPTHNYSLKSINADYNFKNKMLFGIGLGIDSYTRPLVSAKISIKL
jgi:hypothetical protein